MAAFCAVFVGSSSMYVKSESGRGPVWLRELRILCKLCKLWTERRSSRSSRVDLNALITRSCKNREGRSIRKRGGKPATHKHAIFSFRLFFFLLSRRRSVCVVPCTRMYVCMYVCLYVCTCVSRVYSPFPCRRRPVSFRSPCVLCTCYQRIHTGSVVVVLVAVVSRFVTADVFLTCSFILSLLFFRLSLRLFLVSSNFLSLHTTRDVPSIAVNLVAFHPNSVS